MADSQVYSIEEVKQHTTENDCWLVIHGKVYNVTKFLDEHPGGYDIIVINTGKDATESFEEIGHSNAAKELLDQYLIGSFAGGDSSAVKTKAAKVQPAVSQSGGSGAALLKALLPILVILAAVAIMLYKKSA